MRSKLFIYLLMLVVLFSFVSASNSYWSSSSFDYHISYVSHPNAVNVSRITDGNYDTYIQISEGTEGETEYIIWGIEYNISEENITQINVVEHSNSDARCRAGKVEVNTTGNEWVSIANWSDTIQIKNFTLTKNLSGNGLKWSCTDPDYDNPYDDYYIGELHIYSIATILPTNSTWNVTSNNTKIGETTTIWNNGGTVNITSNLLSLTVTASEDTNMSCAIDLNYNYTTMVATNSNYKSATTDTTSHSYTIYDNISIGSHCVYCSFIDASGNEHANSSSGCLGLDYYNSAPYPATLNAPTNGSTNQATTVILNVTISDLEGDSLNVSFINALANTTLFNYTSQSNNSVLNYTWTGLSYNTEYNWFVNVSDPYKHTISNKWNFSTIVDNAPSTFITSPPNETTYYAPSGGGIEIQFTGYGTDDVNVSNCSLWHNASATFSLNKTVSTTNNTNTSITSTLNVGSFLWNFQCTDNISQSSFAQLNHSITILTGYPAVNASLHVNISDIEFIANSTKYNISQGTITDWNVSATNASTYLWAVKNNGTVEGNFTITLMNQSSTYNITCNKTILIYNQAMIMDYYVGASETKYYNCSIDYNNASAEYNFTLLWGWT